MIEVATNEGHEVKGEAIVLATDDELCTAAFESLRRSLAPLLLWPTAPPVDDRPRPPHIEGPR